MYHGSIIYLLCHFSFHKNITPVDVQTIDTEDGDFYVKFGQNTDISTIKEFYVIKHTHLSLQLDHLVQVLDVIPYLYLVGLYIITLQLYVHTIIKTKKAGIKVSIIPYTDEMFSMQSQTVQENTSRRYYKKFRKNHFHCTWHML